MADKNSGILGAWMGMDVQGKLISVMMVGLVVAVGFMGYFYGQLKAVSSGVAGATNVAGAPTGGPGADLPPQPEQPTTVSDEMWDQLLADAAAERGSADASVVMVEFTDYQCPFCKRHFDETDPKILSDYIETGKVRHVVRDLPLPFHTNAHVASQAARCGGDQGKYWEMHDQLFSSQDEWSTGDPTDKFVGYASDLGLNSSSFESCLTSEKYKAAVDADLALANQAGANGTPTFIVNKNILVGALPYASFQTLIDSEL